MEKKLRLILEAKARQARRELRRFGGSVDQLRSGFDKAQHSSGKVRQYQRLGRDLDGLTKKAARNTAAARKNTTAWRSQAGGLAKANRELNRASASTDKLTRRQKTLAKQARHTQKAMQHQAKAAAAKQRRQGVGMGDVMGAAAPAMVVAAPIKQAMDFESAMADVKKVMNFKKPDGLKKLGQDLIKLSSSKIPLTAAAMATIAAAGGQLGIKEANIRSFVVTTSKMAVAWEMAAGDAGDAAAKLSNILRIPISKIELLGDAINHLSDNTAAKGPDLINFMKRSAAVGKAFGLLPTQTLALGDAMIALGKPPEVAARGINFMLNALQTAPDKGKKFKAALNEIGWDADELVHRIGGDAQGTLLEFLDNIASLDEAQQTSVLARLFGTEWADDLASLLSGMEEYRKALNLVGKESDYAGSMQREFANRSATTANKLQIAINKATGISINSGTTLLAPFNTALDVLGKIADKIAAIQEKYPDLVGNITTALGYGLAGLAAFKVAQIGGRFLGGTMGQMYHGGKAAYHKMRGRGGKGGAVAKSAGRGRGVLSTIFGAKVMPVEVINWPGGLGQGGGFDMGGRDKNGRRKKTRKPARARFGRRGKASKLGRVANVFSAVKSRSAGMIQKAAGLAPKAASTAGKVAYRTVPAVVATTATLAPKVLGDVASAAGSAGKVAVNAAPAVAANLAPVSNMVKKAGDVGNAAIKVVPATGKAAAHATTKTAAKVATNAAPAAVALAPKAMSGLAKTASDAGKLATKAAPAAAKAATKATSKTAAKVAGKIAGKIAAKSVGKSILKKIPFLSILAGGIFAADRALAGDWTGAGMELASGFAATIPVGGTIASVGIDAALMARDISKANKAGNAGESPAAVGRANAAARGQASAGDSPAVPIPKLSQATLNSAWRAKQNATIPDPATPPIQRPAIKSIIQPAAKPQPTQPARFNQAAMNAAWRAKQTMGMDASQQGKKLVNTFDAGIKSQAKKPVSTVDRMLNWVRSWLPSSDAKRGPLSHLTASGRAVVTTLGAGIASAGPGPLIAPLAAHFAAVQKQLSHQHLLAGAPVISPLEGSGPPPTLGTGKTESIQKILAELSRLTSPGPADGASIQVTYSPSINAPGADQKSIEKALADDKRQLERLIERTLNRVYGKQQKLSMGNVGV
jgi:TP901 family phage tail tape measure protein